MTTTEETKTMLGQSDIDLMVDAKTHLLWLSQHALDCAYEDRSAGLRPCDCGLDGVLSRLTQRIEEAKCMNIR